MSQKPQETALSKCPGCEEPAESGDRFCGACGYDLSAVPAPPRDRPTVALTVPTAENRPDGAGGSGDFELAAPATADAPESDRPRAQTQTQSPAQPQPRPQAQEATAHAPAAGTSAPAGTGAPSAAQPVPDPRTRTDGPFATPSAGTKLCVACRAGRVDTDGYCENCGHAQPRERDHMEQELGSVAAVSDRGLRHHRNEDSFAVSTTALPGGSPAVVAIVCDGVSSASRPDEASAAAANAANEALLESLPRGTHPQQAMHDAIVAASKSVDSLAGETGRATEHDPGRHQNAPACTLVGAITAGDLLVVGWVGDSRAYWVPDDRSVQPARLTEDDSWAAQMVAAGLMSEAQAYADDRAHAITGWLGADAYELEPHTASFKPDRPGLVVVCTDGLWNYAESAAEMAAVLLADARSRPLHAARALVGHALDGGGHDNVTVALVPFAVTPQGAGSGCDTP
ncbi:protein phosphatase 2C domain-containing protein [Streptomyces sp. NPDC057545]|uniref:PP2C family serine/threonine-protein phosphatase n=1 Tax=Streptomyces sp. NPDC057545 TaxID=3346164 RepID=UPI0036BEEA2B